MWSLGSGVPLPGCSQIHIDVYEAFGRGQQGVQGNRGGRGVCVWACVCVCSQRQTFKWVNRICSVSEADEVHGQDSSAISRPVTAATWGVSGGAWSEGWGNQGGHKPCYINTANMADVRRHEGTWIHETVGFSRKILLAYHCFTMLCAGFHCRAKWIHYINKYVYIYALLLGFPSLLGHCRTLRGAPCAVQ